jgi:hypothetical protein
LAAQRDHDGKLDGVLVTVPMTGLRHHWPNRSPSITASATTGGTRAPTDDPWKVTTMLRDARVATIVLNYRHTEDTVACLAALQRSTCLDQRFVVVDNAAAGPAHDELRAAVAAVTAPAADVAVRRHRWQTSATPAATTSASRWRSSGGRSSC